MSGFALRMGRRSVSRDIKDWLAYTALLCIIGACVGALAVAVRIDFRDSQKCPAGSAYIQHHCLIIVEPLP